MKQGKRVFCMLLILVLMFTGLVEPMGLIPKAAADNVPTVGTGAVGDVPDELQYLGEWVYYVEDGMATVAGYLDQGVTSLQIPSRLSGYAVTGIAHQAFSANKALANIQIPTNVTRIAEDAFDGLYLTISAYHGAYALLFAEQKGFGTKDLSTECVFARGVIDLTGMPGDSYSGLNEYGVTFRADEVSFLAVGQIVNFPGNASYPTGLTKRVESISRTGDQVSVSFSQPEWGECFERVIGEDEVYLDWDHAFVYDGFEMIDDGVGAAKTVTGGKLNKKFNVKLPLGSGYTLTGGVNINVGT